MAKNTTKKVKAWAVLDNGELKPQRLHTHHEGEYWIMPNKPNRKDYHKDFTFAQVEITLITKKKAQ